MPRTEVGTLVVLIGKRDKPANGVKNLRHDPVGGVWVFLCNVIAYIVEVGESFRMERVAATHAGWCAVLRFSLSGGQRLPHRRWASPFRFSIRHSGCRACLAPAPFRRNMPPVHPAKAHRSRVRSAPRAR